MRIYWLESLCLNVRKHSSKISSICWLLNNERLCFFLVYCWTQSHGHELMRELIFWVDQVVACECLFKPLCFEMRFIQTICAVLEISDIRLVMVLLEPRLLGNAKQGCKVKPFACFWCCSPSFLGAPFSYPIRSPELRSRTWTFFRIYLEIFSADLTFFI